MASLDPILVTAIANDGSPPDVVILGEIISLNLSEATSLSEHEPNRHAGIPAEATAQTCFPIAVRSPGDFFLHPVVRNMLRNCGGVMDDEEAGAILLAAVSESSAECAAAMREAVRRGANPDASLSGITSLFLTVGRGHTAEPIECLLFSGAYVDKQSKTRTMHMTPLMMCAYGLGTYRIDVAESLLRHGANPNATTTGATNSMCHRRSKGLTPLIFATLAGDIVMVRLLLRHGAVADIETPDGVTALLCAIVLHAKQLHPSDASIYLDIAQALLEHGADSYRPFLVTVQHEQAVHRDPNKRNIKLSLTPYGLSVGLQAAQGSLMSELLRNRDRDNQHERNQLYQNVLCVMKAGLTTYKYKPWVQDRILLKADLTTAIPPVHDLMESLFS